MAVVCPSCGNKLAVKVAKAGKFAPKCPKCATVFMLVVSDDPAVPPEARPMPANAKVAPRSSQATPSATATQPHVQAPVKKTPIAPARRPALPREEDSDTAAALNETPDSPAADPNATAAFANAPTKPAADANVTGEYEPPAEGEGEGEGKGESEANVTQDFDNSEEAAAPKGRAARGKGVPQRLGGYEVLKELGRGGMGAVFLGRQMSLDRHVALKVMNEQWADDPTFVARFTREAYAAAQLTHHNVVQIYDIGLQGETHFFAMEFVSGKSLGDVLKKQGKLAPEVAVGYVLQAARGLKFGHDMGMIHRDVKPDNLMLNDQGVVKVADLGLVKLPGIEGEEDDEEDEGEGEEHAPAKRKPPKELVGPSDVTRVGVAMGTPTYMAPEQARDASHVDGRADIYSLGCTLYVLLTGKPPFTGKTVADVLSQHATAPVVPPEVIVKRVPKSLSAILIKMMAKKPEERFPDMGAVNRALENFLGIPSDKPFSPQEEHLTALEESVQKYNVAPAARLRGLVFKGFFAGCALVALVALLFGGFGVSVGMVALAVAAAASYFVAQGLADKTHLFIKAREFVLGGSIGDWLTWIGSALLLLAVLFILGLWTALGFAIAGVLVGLGLHFGLDRLVDKQRAAPIEEAEKMFKRLRLQGLEEGALRQFVSKNSGKQWEAFFEEIFGYEAKLAARMQLREDAGEVRQQHAAWRDPLIGWMAARQQARREVKERRLLQKLEEKSLKAKGLSPSEAREKSAQVAEAMVAQAADVQQAKAKQQPPEKMREFMLAARKPKKLNYLGDAKRLGIVGRTLRRVDNVGYLLLGQRFRFLYGAVLLLGCLLWMNQNHLLQWSAFQKAVVELPKTAKPLQLAPVPADVTDFFKTFNVGVAGLILIFSAYCRGWLISLWMIPCAVVAAAGPALGVPPVAPLTADQLSMAAGAAGAVVGAVVRRFLP